MIFTCTINGALADITTGFSVPQQAAAISTASIDVLIPTGQNPPRPWSRVVLLADDAPFFLGFVSSVSSPEFSSGYEVRKYRLSVNSAECLFNNRLVSEALEDMTTTEIIQYLYDNYISAENIALGGIADIAYTYPTYACQYQKLYDVLSEIAGDNNAGFYISPDNKFYFVDRSTFLQIDAPTRITGLSITDESGELRTVQIVSGASEDTTGTTSHVYWPEETPEGGSADSFTVGYSVKSVAGVTIAGVSCGVGLLGVDEENTAKTFLYEVGSNIITLNANATTKPAAGQLVVIVYTGYYDIDVSNTNDTLRGEIAALTGGSGIIEAQYSDETLKDFASADAKANALLSAYDDEEREISGTWRGSGLDDTELYTMWLFAQTAEGITGQYAVVGRTITTFGVDKVSISLQLKNKNFFKRYGTTLVDTTKQDLSGVKVYKNMTIGDTASATDEFILDDGGFVFYPTLGDMFDPMFQDSFYPGY